MSVALWTLLASAAATAGVGLAGTVASRRRGRRFAAEAGRQGLDPRRGDPHGLADDLARGLPVPGTADARVLETLADPAAPEPSGLALLEGEVHPLTGGRRTRHLLRFGGRA